MIVTNKLTMDLVRRGVTQQVDAVQDDRYSRNMEITLYSNGVSWGFPDDCTVAVSYVKPDGTVGKYDTLPDGTTAWSAAGNVLTVALAPQVLTCPGLVSMHVHISTGEAVLSTFEIQLVVQRNPAINAESEDYINMSGFLQIPGQVGQIIQVSAVDADGKVTAVEAVDMPGGESDANVLVVVFTSANLVTGTASHSASEISSAAEAGKLIWGRVSDGYINSGTPIAYIGSIDGMAFFGITATNVDSNGAVGATLICVDDNKTLTITRGEYIMVPSPTKSDIGKTLAVDADYSVAWQTPSGGVNPVQKTEDMTQRVGVDDSGRLWTAPGGVSSDAWELIADITLEEQVTSFSIDEDMDGEPFSLRKYLLAYAWAQVTDGSEIPSYMFLAENNRQYGESRPPLYTSAFNVASATGKTAGVISAELLPNNVISEECWRTSVDANISLEPFQPMKDPMPNTYRFKAFKQHSDFAPFYQIGGYNGVLAAGSRIMLWGVRK